MNEWILILTTWMEFVAPKTIQLPMTDVFECRRLEIKIEQTFEVMPESFGYMIECEPLRRASDEDRQVQDD